MKSAALVTGGSKRIGKGIAVSLAMMGYDIALHYNTSEDDALKTCDEISSLGVDAHIFKADFNKKYDRGHLMEMVLEKFSNLTMLINNASLCQSGGILDTDETKLEGHFNINFAAPYMLSRDFARLCGKGHIINIIDSKVTHNEYTHASYMLSKKGLAEFTMLAARQFAPSIRVNAIAPGIILSPDTDDKSLSMNRKAVDTPLKRKGNISCVTKAVRYLIENDFVTGQILFADGGEHL